MNEILDKIKEATNQKELHDAGVAMRSFLLNCPDAQVRDLVLAAWMSKSRKMVNPKQMARSF